MCRGTDFFTVSKSKDLYNRSKLNTIVINKNMIAVDSDEGRGKVI